MTPSTDSARRRIRYYDAHNHLQDDWLAPYRDRVNAHLETLPIERAVVNGTWEQDWPHVQELADRHPWILPSFGVHPWLVGKRSPQWEAELTRRLEAEGSAAVGEIGLDRWILDRARPDDPRLEGLPRAPLAEQQEVFKTQLDLAVRYRRPVTIHCLDAWGALWDILRDSPVPSQGFLLHAYGGSTEMVPGFVERGAFFSFNGYFLGERKERQQHTFREIPLTRLLVETDAPSMPPPLPWRTYKLPPGPGNMPLNHPGNIEAVYVGLAALRGLALEELSTIIEENFRRLFSPAAVL